jgi:hypothetical protein
MSYPVFMDAGLLSPFNLKRGAYFLLVPLPVLAICMHLGHGVLGLALMAVAFWPLPFRCHVEPAGIRVSWLVVQERVPWSDIVGIEHEEDRRRGVVGRRSQVLCIERRDKPRITLRGRAAVLSRLAAELTQRAR